MEKPHLTHLNAFFPEDKVSQREILTDFIELTPAILDKIEQAIAQNQPQTVRELLHPLYPNLYYMGLTQAQQIAKHYSHELSPDSSIPAQALFQLCQDIRAALPEIIRLRDTLM